MKAEQKRILIVRTDRIGDVVLSLPVVTALRRFRPDAHLSMLVQPAMRDLVKDHPDLDEVIEDGADFRRSAGFFRFVRRLRAGAYDTVLLLHPRPRLAWALFLAGIPLRVGTAYRAYSVLFNKRIREHRKTSTRHEAEYNLSLAAAIGADRTPVRFGLAVTESGRDEAASLLKKKRIQGKRPLVVIHPGSRGSALDWPPERFAALADRLSAEKNATILVTGVESERDLINEFEDLCKQPVIPVVGELKLPGLIALLDSVDLVVANSTGPLHIAAAMGTRVFGLYPPLRPASVRRWGPWGQPENTITADFPECKRCNRKCRDGNCMLTISVEAVWEKIVDLLP